MTRPRTDCEERTFSKATALQSCVSCRQSGATASHPASASGDLGGVAQRHKMLLRRSGTTQEGAFEEFLLTIGYSACYDTTIFEGCECCIACLVAPTMFAFYYFSQRLCTLYLGHTISFPDPQQTRFCPPSDRLSRLRGSFHRAIAPSRDAHSVTRHVASNTTWIAECDSATRVTHHAPVALSQTSATTLPTDRPVELCSVKWRECAGGASAP